MLVGTFKRRMHSLRHLRKCENYYLLNVVDTSNCSNNYARLRDGRMSHAEELARLLPASVSLVKALNSLELEDLECDRALVRDVAVAGDNPAARVLVASLVQLLHITIDTVM